jgi:hypothetical protein
MEMRRPNIPVAFASIQGGAEPIAALSVSSLRELCDAYFATFNLANPVLDRKFFFHHTLVKAIHKDFDYDLESCLVFTVMALGCWGIRALQEAGITNSSGKETTKPLTAFIESDVPGLYFFNEARRRYGLVANDNGMQSCQYHLLTGYV